MMDDQVMELPGQELRRGRDEGGARWFVGADAIHAGDMLELLCCDRWRWSEERGGHVPELDALRWRRVRFETSAGEPVLYERLPGGAQLCCPSPAGARFRVVRGTR